MRPIFFFFTVTVMGASVWANPKLPSKQQMLKTSLEVRFENQTNQPALALPEVTTLYLLKNSRIKRALKFKVKRRHQRLA
jgi:hypothetical protein